MRASVHVKVPNLTSDGTDAQAKTAAKPLGLSVRGTGGEHTPIGADGTIDLSPSNRLFITEAEIITKLYNGIKLLLEKEAAAAGAAAGGTVSASAEPQPASRVVEKQIISILTTQATQAQSKSSHGSCYLSNFVKW